MINFDKKLFMNATSVVIDFWKYLQFINAVKLIFSLPLQRDAPSDINPVEGL